MKTRTGLLAALTLISHGAIAAPLDDDLARFVSWFGGEWNNNEQVWQQRVDAKGDKSKIEDPISHTHHIFAPVAAPSVGSHVFYVQQHLDADMSKSYRQRVYRFSADTKENAVKLEIFNLPDDKEWFNAHLTPEKFKDLDAAALKTTAGCEVYWRFQPAQKSFEGTMKPDACSFFSQRQGKKIIISDTLKLTEDEIWINDQAKDEQGNHVFGSKTNTPIKNRKVRYFTGWAYINHAGKNAGENDKEFSFRRDLLLHTEGQVIPLLYKDGTPAAWAKANDLVLTTEIKNYTDAADAMASLVKLSGDNLAADVQNANDTATRNKAIVIIVFLLGIVLVGVFVVAVIRSISAPIGELRDRLQDISDGEGDLTARVSEDGHDEITEVSALFNTFVGQIGDIITQVAESANTVAAAAEELSITTRQIASATEEASVQASSVNGLADNVSTNVQAVAAGAEQMGAAITEIARNTTEAARVAQQGLDISAAANQTVVQLGDSSQEIGEVLRGRPVEEARRGAAGL